jgi:transcriptional regulator with XRE-family HTH domain
MSSRESKSKQPYLALGTRLKTCRQNAHKSLAEVSGAVEIDAEMLESIENGEFRPTEDILLLLINYFNVQGPEAAKLWQLAGFDDPRAADQFGTGEDQQQMRQPITMTISPAMDTRVIYTDMVHVMVNNYGVVINFMQAGGSDNQPVAVARVGMSREHAESVVQVLQQTLGNNGQQGPHLLSDGSDTPRL